MKNKIKMLSLLLSVLLVLILDKSVGVNAATESKEVTADSSPTVDVAWDIPSTFSVLIPKRIVFDGSTLQGNYVVGVKGDIGSNKKVVVIPRSSTTLSQEGKADVIAAVTQEKTEWLFNEISVDSYTMQAGNLTAASASAGLYTGDLMFTISLDGVGLVAGLYDENDVMLCSWEDSGIDVSIDYINMGTGPVEGVTLIAETLANNWPATKKVVIPDGFTTIGIGAFYGCTGLTSVIIQNGVTTIGDYAFARSGLTSVTIPDSVTTIGSTAFYSCSSLTSVTYAGTAYTSKSALTSAMASEGVSIGTHAFGSTALTD